MLDLKIGDNAPLFEGVNQNGDKIGLTDFKDKKLILYFYPKDNTPGCTAESCNLNDNYEMWIEKGFEVVGISPDSEKSHLKFINKFGLKFNLISDTEKEILQALIYTWALSENLGNTKKFRQTTCQAINR